MAGPEQSAAPTLAGRRAAVLGAGRSGQSAAKLALRLGAEVCLVDSRADAVGVDGAALYTGEVDVAGLGADLVLVSPGIAAASPWVRSAAASGAEVVGELGFAAQFLSAPLAAITGTNGKSTTTSFLAQLLEGVFGEGRVFAGGNLGTPLSEAALAALDGVRWAALAVEVSSYQLELPGDFRPDAAAILNLTPDHLGRHGDMAGYADAKCRLFDRMGPTAPAAIPWGDPWLTPAAEGRGGARRWLGASPGVTLDGRVARSEYGDVDLSDLQVDGAINRWNAATACWLAMALGARPDQLELSRLRALSHRTERVRVRGGVTWINDSKATNVEATLAALGGFESPAAVLLGGSPKDGSDYRALAPALAGARAVICFGQTGSEIAAALQGGPGPAPILLPDLEAAIEAAAGLTRPGDIVLLSPACASFDAFQNFAHRGDRFRSLVQALPGLSADEPTAPPRLGARAAAAAAPPAEGENR